MVTTNLLWPTWARVVATKRFEELRSRYTLNRAACLLADAAKREQDARAVRFARLNRAARPGLRPLRILVLTLALWALALSPLGAEEEKREESKLFRAMGWAVWVVSAGDAASTEIGLASNPYLYEGNPLQRNRYVRIASHVSYPVVVNRQTAALYQKGKTRQALWIRIGMVAGFGYLTAHNLRAAAR